MDEELNPYFSKTSTKWSIQEDKVEYDNSELSASDNTAVDRIIRKYGYATV